MATRARKATTKAKVPARKGRKTPKAAASKRTPRTAGKRAALCTIGYEKALPGAVIGELTRAGVKLVVDVRAVAASRRPGFSKKQLAAGLDEAGIGYLHLQPLGTPEAGREAARAGNIDALFRIYDRHLQTKASQVARRARRSGQSAQAPACSAVLLPQPECLPPQPHRRRARTDNTARGR